MSDRDLHAEFERIIAGWDDEAPDPQPRHGTSDPAAVRAKDAETDAGVDTDRDTGVDTDVYTDQVDTDRVDTPGTATAEATAAVAPEPAPTPTDDPTDAATDAVERAPDRTTDPTAPPGQPGQPDQAGQPGASGLLELPIAPMTSHAWRGSTPRRDDADEILDAVEPYGDHFVPPSEIDLPSAETDPMYWAIVGGLAGGPLLLLYVLFFDRDGSGWWVVTALTMIVVGFVLLVLRGGTERDPFDDGTRV